MAMEYIQEYRKDRLPTIVLLFRQLCHKSIYEENHLIQPILFFLHSLFLKFSMNAEKLGL